MQRVVIQQQYGGSPEVGHSSLSPVYDKPDPVDERALIATDSDLAVERVVYTC